MADRPVFTDPDFEHGAKGYRAGCGCEVCREGQRLRVAEQRLVKKQATATATTDAHTVGKVEQTVKRELKEASDCAPPWVQTLRELAIKTARAIDNLPDDKLSPLEGRLLDILDRIRTAAPVGPSAPPPSPADEVEDYVNGLRKLGE